MQSVRAHLPAGGRCGRDDKHHRQGLTAKDWPPNYVGELRRRAYLELAVARNPELLRGAMARYAESATAFASDCAWLHEPRNANIGEPVVIPVVFFPRQADFLDWLAERYCTRKSVRIFSKLTAYHRRGRPEPPSDC
jgi:hypothetical protein